MRTRGLLGLGWILLTVAPVGAQTLPLEGGRGAAFRTMADPARNRGKVIFGSASIVPVSPLCPTTSSLQLTASGFAGDTIDLPCANWRARGRGFVYDDRAATSGVRRIQYKPGRLSILLQGAGLTAPQGPVTFVATHLSVAGVEHCGRFENFTHNQADRIRAKGPSVPCPAATATATPSLEPTATMTVSPTQTAPATPTEDATATETAMPAETATPSASATASDTPTITPTPTDTPTPTPTPTSTPHLSGNLYSDPGFEISNGGCFAQEPNDSALRSTADPIVETASLAVATLGYGNNVWCQVNVPGLFANHLDVAASMRRDAASPSNVQFCAIVYYADGDFATICNTIAAGVGVTANAASALSLDSARPLSRVGIRMAQEGSTPISYSIDEISAVLTVVDGVIPATPTPTATFDGTPVTPAPTPTGSQGFYARLTDSGSTAHLPVLLDAQEPAELGLTPALNLGSPGPECPRLLGMINPAVAIPTNSTLRQLEASWNGTPLPVIDPGNSGLVEEPHGYGSSIPFFKPLFSLAGLPAGSGTLEVRGYDAAHNLLATVAIPDLQVDLPPTPRSASDIAALGHPRLWLTPARLAQARARDIGTDLIAQRFYSETIGLEYFLDRLAVEPDPTSLAFSYLVYDPESYIPMLSLCYQIEQVSNPTRAATCASAARALALNIAEEYDSGERNFGRDYGYDIRFAVMQMMTAYDWIYDEFTPQERELLARIATDFVDWYPGGGGYAAHNPVENYYTGYVSALTLTAIATAGDNPDADRLLGDLRTKLTTEMPILNQRACGGDWPEGWNYGPFTLQSFATMLEALRSVGEDWSAVFDFLAPTARTLAYQQSPDAGMLRQFGGYSGDRPHFMSPALLAVLSGTTTDAPLAAELFKRTAQLPLNPDDSPGGNFYDGSRGFKVFEMLFADLSLSADLSALPLSRLVPGTGKFFSFSSMSDPQAYQVIAEASSIDGDHFGYSNGDVRLYQGVNCLICPRAYRGQPFGGEDETEAFSSFLVNGSGQWVDRNNQILFTQENGTFAAVGLRFESAYPISRYDESIINSANPLDYLIREVVHLRPGTIVVRDLHRRRTLTDTLQALWHLGTSASAEQLDAQHFRIAPLQASFFSSVPMTTAFATDTDHGNNPIGTRIEQDIAATTNGVEVVSVFSETLWGTSYANGELALSDGTCVTFASGGVDVAPCP